MGLKLYDENDIQNIANAIREKGVEGSFKVSEMADAIINIPTTSYYLYSWQITSTRTMPPHANALQLSEFRVFDDSGNKIQMLGVTSDLESASLTESILNIIDGKTDTKYVTILFYSKGKCVIEFLTKTPIKSYQYCTANDQMSRDASTWELYENNVLVDTVTNYSAPEGRTTWTQLFNIHE